MKKIISNSYLQEQIKLHQNNKYGMASVEHAPNIKKIMVDNNLKSISDFGAGKKRLLTSLHGLNFTDFEYYPYDPVFEDYGLPQPADLVCCIDVMEHVEEEYTDTVLDEISNITLKFVYFSISFRPASKLLSDGTNAHINIKPPRWWVPKLCSRFNINFMTLNDRGRGFIVICHKLTE